MYYCGAALLNFVFKIHKYVFSEANDAVIGRPRDCNKVYYYSKEYTAVLLDGWIEVYHVRAKLYTDPITKTRPCNIQKKNVVKMKIFTGKCLIFFLFLLKT